VPITLRLTNTTSKPITLYLRGRAIAFDLTVTRADGEVVWRRLEGETVPAILQVKELAPGEALALEDTWDQRTNLGDTADPENYTVQGAVLTDQPDPIRTPAVPISIVR
jgi:Intracellular proteinase inhibitor